MSNNFIKPNLFVPGAGKSGTSSLHDYLNLHPDIYMSDKKEPHYFSHDKQFQQKEKYYRLFAKSAGKMYRGESSTGYMVFPNVICRIKQEINYPKFVFVLRNPIDRCFSHYQWVRSFAAEPRDFINAVRFDMFDEPDSDNDFGGGYKYYYQFGLYGKWLKEFFESFDSKDICIITTESLKENRLETLNHIFEFLGLEKINELPNIVSNTTSYYKDNIRYLAKLKILYRNNLDRGLSTKLKACIPASFRKHGKYMTAKVAKSVKVYSKTSEKPRMTKEDRAWLQSLYAEDVRSLKTLTGMDFSQWLEFES